MATTVTLTGKNKALSYLAGSCAYAAALDATAELSGGTPTYARKAITFRTVLDASSTGAVITATTLPVFDIPAGKRVTRIAYYTTLAGTRQMAIDDVTAEAFTAQGTYTLTSGTIKITDPS